MNWGQKITIFFILFICFMAGMVTICLRTDFFLVEENYYQEEIAYQSKIDQLRNGLNWNKRIDISEGEGAITIYFEDADLIQAGEIKFLRPSNAGLDFSFPIVEAIQLPTSKIAAGKWIIEMKWHFNGINYVKEQTLIVKS